MPKILLAEDDHLTRITLGKFLRSKGYEVEVAEDSAQAISLLKQMEFDLVVSDVVMPNGNGWVLFEQVRSLAPETPVLLMTAYSEIQQSVSRTHPAPELVLKPLLLTDLLSKIQQLLRCKAT